MINNAIFGAKRHVYTKLMIDWEKNLPIITPKLDLDIDYLEDIKIQKNLFNMKCLIILIIIKISLN